MKEGLNVMRQVLCSIPLGIGWMFTYAWIVLGWGLKAGDEYIKAWQNFAEATYDVLHPEKKYTGDSQPCDNGGCPDCSCGYDDANDS